MLSTPFTLSTRRGRAGSVPEHFNLADLKKAAPARFPGHRSRWSGQRNTLERPCEGGVRPPKGERQREEKAMLKLSLAAAAGVLAVGLAGTPSLAQQAQPPATQVQP